MICLEDILAGADSEVRSKLLFTKNIHLSYPNYTLLNETGQYKNKAGQQEWAKRANIKLLIS